MLKPIAVAISLALLPTLPAMAASGDAWAEFAQEVEQGCLGATEGMLEKATAIVDPFGSEAYGLAIVSGEVGDGQQASILCVFDKQSKAVQIGGELPITVTPNS
ncbi:MAG: hypothetical protein ABW043_04355 [Devosia sp.]|uniref:hypothetical protein n=1 Tax=Devosia sp. TaxID=1871048 RepID=UPI00339679FA